MSTLASSILRARETQYVEMLQNRYFHDNVKCPLELSEEEPLTEGVELTELSILWITFFSVCAVSTARFLLEQKRGFDELRRQESQNKLVELAENSNANSDDETEEVTTVSMESDLGLEEMVEKGEAITNELNNSPKQEMGKAGEED